MSNNIEHKAFWDAEYELVNVCTGHNSFTFARQVTGGIGMGKTWQQLLRKAEDNLNLKGFEFMSGEAKVLDFGGYRGKDENDKIVNGPNQWHLSHHNRFNEFMPNNRHVHIDWKEKILKSPMTFIEWIKLVDSQSKLLKALNEIILQTTLKNLNIKP